MSLGVIRAVMSRFNLTQAEMAIALQSSLQRVKDLSSGRVNGLKSAEASSLVEKLHLNMGWVVTGEGEMFAESYQPFTQSELFSEVLTRISELSEAPKTDSLATWIGFDQKTFNSWLKKQKVPLNVLEGLAKKYSSSVEYLLFGGGEKPSAQMIPSEKDGIEKYVANEQSPSFNNLVRIPQYEIRASAGNGCATHEESVIGFLEASREWVRNVIHAEPGKLAIITVDGDSMEPSLQHGEQVLLDLRRNRFDNDAVYAIQYNGLLRIKRVQILHNGHIVIKSDNPAYEPETLSNSEAADLRVIGRVLPWKFGKFKL